jgi:chorismate dehydratase
MEMKQLFSSSSSRNKETDSGLQNYIGLIDSLEYYPLIYGLQKNLSENTLNPIYSKPNEVSQLLKEGQVELALIPSIEYARKKETWRIIPDLCLACSGAAKNLQLLFKKGLKEIKKIAVDTDAEMVLILLRILMKEKFIMDPEFIFMSPDIEKMFAKADAALLTGDSALKNLHLYPNRLDLNEEWVDLTGLPFVYSFWAGREFTVSKKDLGIVRNSYEVGKRNIENISKDYATSHSESWSFYHDFLTRNMQYVLTEEAKDGLTEYYNYAFFFGFSEFIPDLHFYEL